MEQYRTPRNATPLSFHLRSAHASGAIPYYNKKLVSVAVAAITVSAVIQMATHHILQAPITTCTNEQRCHFVIAVEYR